MPARQAKASDSREQIKIFQRGMGFKSACVEKQQLNCFQMTQKYF